MFQSMLKKNELLPRGYRWQKPLCECSHNGLYQGDPCLSECYAVRVGIGRLTAVLFSLAVGAKHVNDFVLVELLHVVAGRTEVLAGVELSGLLGENLAHSGGHGETAV